MTNPLGARTTCTYDGAGHTTRITDALGHSQAFTYNFLGEMTGATDAFGHTTTYQFDAAGNQVQRTDRNGGVTRYTYDADRQLLSVVLPGGATTLHTYDPLHRPTSLTNADAAIQFTYDDASHVIAQVSSGTASSPQPNVTLTYAYDASGSRTSIAGPDGATSYTHDAATRLASVAPPGGGSGLQLGYDVVDRIVSLSRPDGANDTRRYDAAGQLVNNTTASGASTLARMTYAYDVAGHRSSADHASGTSSYAYDAAGQLTAASHPTGSGLSNEAYAYDAAGNRTAGSATYDAGGRLAGDAAFTYTYDNEGDLLSRTDRSTSATTHYVWNAHHQLLAVQRPDGTQATYRYDPLGRRVEVNDHGAIARYVWDGSNVHLEDNASNVLQAAYTTGPGLSDVLAVNRGGQTTYAVVDALQTFGSPSPANPSTPSSPFGFAGLQSDAGTGLVYARARYYDPVAGRFVSEDPLAAVNRYQYANNDPTDLTDPRGQGVAECVRGFFFGAILVLGAAEAHPGGDPVVAAFAACAKVILSAENSRQKLENAQSVERLGVQNLENRLSTDK